MMEQYPRTLMELERQFGDEAACRAYLFSLRWPQGFSCPHCRGQTAWAMTGGRWLCAGCRKQVSVTASTIFQDSKLPLVVGFRAIWQLTSQKNCVSAMGPQRILGRVGDGTTAPFAQVANTCSIATMRKEVFIRRGSGMLAAWSELTRCRADHAGRN